MKYLFTLIGACFLFASTQAQTLTKIWETDTTIAVPESVLLHKGGFTFH